MVMTRRQQAAKQAAAAVEAIVNALPIPKPARKPRARMSNENRRKKARNAYAKLTPNEKKARYAKAKARRAAKLAALSNEELATMRFQKVLERRPRKTRSNKGVSRKSNAQKIGEYLNKQKAIGIAPIGFVPKATGGTRKVRSNKGVPRGPRGPRPETVEKRAAKAAAKAKAAMQKEANRLQRVLAIIAKRRSLSANQKDQALVNAVNMSAKNLKAKYIIVQKRVKAAKKAKKANSPVAARTRSRRSKVNNLN